MARQQRGGGGDVARGAGYAALLGALLIGVAVVIGIVLLQIGDDNDNGPASAAPGNSTTSTTTTTTTTAVPTGQTGPSGTTPQRPPSAVRLIVLNGGAPSGKAGDMAESLKVKGYTNQPQKANDWSGHDQTGDSVYCRAGFDREGAALAIAVGSGVPLNIPYPTPPPPFSSDVDCVVVVGASGTTATTGAG